ncbi:glycine zipper 2TM domain-containing protein [Janthinobacterium fluminis]|uniref:Glycine zipper 2TM domain-containing protein n=1 Tax=Janthinobacterium fluminis TaxID=2987524 RepID=A0ABT5K3P1_9BURK|nr:glycine zipper 2TM domain-containing protein [Janthinobacterium fluminis]MDC8759028.1 glycine zipper 2TM domain-containing protein [Janthinobacterium fluminis]
MNLQAKLLLSALCVGALPVAQAADFEEFGRVVRVTPQVEQVNRPRQECRTEYVQVQQPQQQRSAGGAIIGGIAGALLGNQVGGGSGRSAATAAGAIAGAITGDRLDNNGGNSGGGVQEQAVKQCRTVDHWESRNNGYEVTYDYRGRNYTSLMSYDPGQRVRLRVSVEPAQQ